jgi:16S rRNA (uracil1498-N3)-methyltransferase
MPRIYQAIPLQENLQIVLDVETSHYLSRVLRAQVHDAFTVFNGRGGEYAAEVLKIGKKAVTLQVHHFIRREVESPLQICLAQGLAKGEKMDLIIQKAVELGVQEIQPLYTQYSNVKLDAARQAKKMEHWQAIIVSACEQSGRNQLPILHGIMLLEHWLKSIKTVHKYILAPDGNFKLRDAQHLPGQSITLVIGPEGGFSQIELNLANQQGFSFLVLGPRILRTETAGLAIIAALQTICGDM